MEPAVLVPPKLSQGELYHVFCCYSSKDHMWTKTLIQKLEESGLRVCDHERDFIPGVSVLENMSGSIQQSQKVLLVLSTEFVRSRWCLLEASMAQFRECLERKAIVPVVLEQDVLIPLHLKHLTHLDAHKPEFIQQLLKVLYSPNQTLPASQTLYADTL